MVLYVASPGQDKTREMVVCYPVKTFTETYNKAKNMSKRSLREAVQYQLQQQRPQRRPFRLQNNALVRLHFLIEPSRTIVSFESLSLNRTISDLQEQLWNTLDHAQRPEAPQMIQFVSRHPPGNPTLQEWIRSGQLNIDYPLIVVTWC